MFTTTTTRNVKPARTRTRSPEYGQPAQAGSAVATMEPQGMPQAQQGDVPARPARKPGATDQPETFTVDLMNDWCKP